jgi:hypothetical protein
MRDQPIDQGNGTEQRHDRPRRRLLHVDFRWTSHTGEDFDRAAYVKSNTGGRTQWLKQDLGDPDVVVIGNAAVVRTVVMDAINTETGSETFRMPMTQFWVRMGSRWRCLAGHAGPRLPS